MSPGKTIAIETLARVLFAIIVDGPKIPQAASTNILAVAHLLNEKLENGIMENMANNISLHIKDTLNSLTSDLHVKLDHSETAQTQKELTENLIQAQKHLDKTTQKAISTTKTYSQAAATIPTTTAPIQTPPPDVPQPDMPPQPRGNKEKTSPD